MAPVMGFGTHRGFAEWGPGFAVSKGLLPNPGWEEGAFGDWTHVGVPGQIAGIFRTIAPFRGSYQLGFYTGFAGGIIGTVSYRITDAGILARLKGNTVQFETMARTLLEFSGSDASNRRRISIQDDAGTTTSLKITSNTWTSVSIQRTITVAPTFVEFQIRYDKAGGAAIYTFVTDEHKAGIVA